MSILKRAARRMLGRPAAPRVTASHPFDAQHGVDTSGLLEAHLLRTGHANDAFSTAYFGVPPSRFRNALERWRATPGVLPLERYRFIDVGCGKGRALLLAATMPFRDVFGVELHPELAATARRNLESWKQQVHARTSVTVVCADAPSSLPTLLDGPVLIYLYNPFREPALRAMLQRLTAAPAALTGPVDILYLYPEHEAVFTEFPQFQRLWREEIAMAHEDANDGLSAATDPCSLYRLEVPERTDRSIV